MNQKAILKIWSENFNNANLVGILNLYDPKSILIPTFSPEILSSKKQIKKYFSKLLLEKSSVEIQLNSIIEQKIGEDFYMLSGNYIFKLAKDNKVPARFSFIINPLSSNPIKHHHSSPITKID